MLYKTSLPQTGKVEPPLVHASNKTHYKQLDKAVHTASDSKAYFHVGMFSFHLINFKVWRHETIICFPIALPTDFSWFTGKCINKIIRELRHAWKC